MPAAWYKASGGKALGMPQDVRWNTMADWPYYPPVL